jgi:hypothetical protein
MYYVTFWFVALGVVSVGALLAATWDYIYSEYASLHLPNSNEDFIL